MEREHLLAMLPGVSLLLERPEPTVVAILHGWFVGWIAPAATGGLAGASDHAVPLMIDRPALERSLRDLTRDPYRS